MGVTRTCSIERQSDAPVRQAMRPKKIPLLMAKAPAVFAEPAYVNKTSATRRCASPPRSKDRYQPKVNETRPTAGVSGIVLGVSRVRAVGNTLAGSGLFGHSDG